MNIIEIFFWIVGIGIAISLSTLLICFAVGFAKFTWEVWFK